MNPTSNERSALDARTALYFHVDAHRPGASESERWHIETDEHLSSKSHGVRIRFTSRYCHWLHL